MEIGGPNHSFTPFILTNEPLIGCDKSFTSSKDFSSAETGAIALLALISISTSVTVGYTIFYNEKLRVHPSKLIGYMCICEAASCFSALIWVIDPRRYSCYFAWHYFFNYLTG